MLDGPSDKRSGGWETTEEGVGYAGRISASIRAARRGGSARWGIVLGEMAYRLCGPYRTIVQRNLKFAFPSWKEHRVAAVSRQVFHNMGMTLIEMVQCARMSRGAILARCRLKGEDHFIRALEGGRGVIIVSAHLGSWEIGLQYLACHLGKRVHIVVRPLTPRWLDRWVSRARARFGNHLILKKRAFPSMLKAIREGGVVALMVDLSTRKQSVAVDYFGHRARANPAAALLASRCDTPIIGAFTIRNPDGSLSIQVTAPVVIQRTGSLKDDLQCNTQRITAMVEKAVREHPDQYFWVQKRWKDYHPYLYPGYRPRTGRLEEQ